MSEGRFGGALVGSAYGDVTGPGIATAPARDGSLLQQIEGLRGVARDLEEITEVLLQRTEAFRLPRPLVGQGNGTERPRPLSAPLAGALSAEVDRLRAVAIRLHELTASLDA